MSRALSKNNTVTVSLHDSIRAKHTPAHKETEAKIHTPRGESKKLLNAQNGLNSSMGIALILIVKAVFCTFRSIKFQIL